jgi:ribosomal protein S18 acetylase RimI-like enzyme
MKAVIRPATMTDVAGMAEVHVRTWQTGYAGLMPAEFLDSLSVERSQRGLTRTLTNLGPTATLLVADLGGEIAGFVYCGPSIDDDTPPDGGQVYMLYVAASHWRAGVGRQLNDAALKALYTNGFRSAHLWVLRTNTRACKFYASVGWTADGTEREEEFNGLMVDEARYAHPMT